MAQDGTRTFRLSPLPYDVRTTATTSYKKGVVTDLALGRNVKVNGTYNGTQFIADEIQFKDNVQDPPTFDVDGIASNVMPASVVVNGKTIGLTNATTYTKNGAAATAADLKNGLTVEIVAVKVKGDLVAVSVEIKAAGERGGDGARHRQRPRLVDRDGVPGRRAARQRGRQSEGHPGQQDAGRYPQRNRSRSRGHDRQRAADGDSGQV